MKKSSFGAIVFTLGFEQVHFTKSQRIYLVSDKKTEKAKVSTIDSIFGKIF